MNLSITPSVAAPGVLDESFGTGGVETTTIDTTSEIKSIAIDVSGRIVAGGVSNDGTGVKFTLARYSETGALDISFGIRGINTFTVLPYSLINAIAIDSSGRIIAGGISSYDAYAKNFILARFSDTGTVDTSFGNEGIETTTIGTQSNIKAIALDNEGRIIAGGYSHFGYGEVFAVARYSKNGTLDQSFGFGGVATTTIGTYAAVSSIKVDSSGRIMVGGSTCSGSGLLENCSFTLARYSETGTLDTTFGKNLSGVETTTIGVESGISSIAIDSSGRIIAGGASLDSGGSPSSAIARYSKNGTLDESFGTGGIATTTIGSNSRIRSIAIDSSGRIVTGGVSFDSISNSFKFTVARYLKNGTLDPLFGVGGSHTNNISRIAEINSIAIDNSGRIIAGGFSSDGSGDYIFALARYLNPSPPGSTPIPDPVQLSKITGVLPSTSVSGSSTPVVISGSFVEPISNIFIDGIALATGGWSQSPSAISFTLPISTPGTYSIQLFNGSVPILAAQSITLTEPVVVEPAPTVTPALAPTVTPVPASAPVNAKPAKSKKRIIICTNGKKSSKVKSVKPKCPKGFKKKVNQ